MKRLFVILLWCIVLTGLAQPSFSAEATWFENLDQAKAVAQQEGKYIFMDFSGSDWCHWCIKLDRDILSKEEFIRYAEEKLVLVKIDFPKRSHQSDEQKRQNERLASQYSVRGFPTVILLSPQGELIAVTGYRDGGAEAYVKHIEALINQ